MIGTNKKDAQETVDAMLADLTPASNGNHAASASAGASAAGSAAPATALAHVPATPDAGSMEALLRARQPELVTYAGWEAIDRHERALGEPSGRPAREAHADRGAPAGRRRRTAVDCSPASPVSSSGRAPDF